MQVYNVDFNKLGKTLLPNSMRFHTFYAIVESVMKPLQTRLSLSLNFRTQIKEQMKYSSQVCYMRGLLNDLYDSGARRIKITGQYGLQHLTLYRRLENMPVLITNRSNSTPLHINRRDVINSNGLFKISLPLEFLDNQELVSKIRTSIENYKLVTKQYYIIYE